jgi:hypothetical protein
MKNNKNFNNQNPMNWSTKLGKGGSLFLARLYRVSAKAHLTVPIILHEILIGSLLGDLFAEKPNKNCNTRIQFKQSIINKEYLDHMYTLFKEFCNSSPLVLSRFDDRPNKNKEYTALKFQTASLPCFNIYRELFYNSEGRKILPLNLGELLTERGLAYWLMDDGYKSGKGLYICVESFTLDEINFLINILKSKFGLECSYHKVTNGYRIYI